MNKTYIISVNKKYEIIDIYDSLPSKAEKGKKLYEITKKQYDSIKNKKESFLFIKQDIVKSSDWLKKYYWYGDEDSVDGYWVKYSIQENIPTWAFRSQLKIDNIFDDVVEFIDSLPNQEKILFGEILEYSNTIKRQSDFVQKIKEFLNKSDDDMDDIFQKASTLIELN